MVVDAASEEETLETETEDIEEEFPYYGLNDKEFVSKASMRLDRKIEVVNEISISAEDGALYIDGEKYLLSENACSEVRLLLRQSSSPFSPRSSSLMWCTC